ncbi:MAG: lysophospholipid acyltransferase family protein [Tagaea sp.]
MRKLRQLVEAAFVIAGYRLLGRLPKRVASNLGGAVARFLGPKLRVSERARRNLRRFMPELGEDGIERTVREMWDNLGRTAAEYPHLTRMTVFVPDADIEVAGTEHVDAAKAAGKPIIFFAAHLANWELAGLAAARHGTPVHLVYREANNRHVETLFREGRGAFAEGLIPKGASGARLAMQALKQGKHLGMLLDQKMNDGIAVPFFGVDAMTAPALATLAPRFDCAVLPVRVERLEAGPKFRVTVEPPIELPRSGDKAADARALMTAVNARMEAWIRARPGQWLWLHRRWPEA